MCWALIGWFAAWVAFILWAGGQFGCAPMRPPLPAPAVDVSTRGKPVCTGVRIAPTVLATARHCTEHGWQLSVDGTPATKIASLRQDVALLRVPRGPFTPQAFYEGEDFVRVASFAGIRTVRVLHWGAATGLELEGECVPGESGAPVSTGKGVVAVVTNGDPGRPCYAQWVAQ